ncbi:MAG: exodeoxyribonuclease VII small subunit [Candidatus Latescibacter sp.]|nr:exodeoxyribonuclease VII small subunit [Candidatus Latescibacter sp.]
MAEAEEKNFEALLKRLEEIVEKMDSGGLSLEEYLNLYEEGMKKAETLTAMLAEAREKVMKLVVDKNGKPSIEPFEGCNDKDEG